MAYLTACLHWDEPPRGRPCQQCRVCQIMEVDRWFLSPEDDFPEDPIPEDDNEYLPPEDDVPESPPPPATPSPERRKLKATPIRTSAPRTRRSTSTRASPQAPPLPRPTSPRRNQLIAEAARAAQGIATDICTFHMLFSNFPAAS